MNRGKFEPRPCTSFSESKFHFWALTLIQSVPGTKSFSKPEAFRFGRVCLGGRHSCRLLVFSPNRLYAGCTDRTKNTDWNGQNKKCRKNGKTRERRTDENIGGLSLPYRTRARKKEKKNRKKSLFQWIGDEWMDCWTDGRTDWWTDGSAPSM